MTTDNYASEYHPVVADASEFFSSAGAGRFLLVGKPLAEGEGLPEGCTETAECRWQSDEMTDHGLPTGNYRFRTHGGCAVLLVNSNIPRVSAQRGSADSGGNEFLATALVWFEHLWSNAQLIPPPAFAEGDDVVTVPGGQDTSIKSRRFSVGGWFYRAKLDGFLRSFTEAGLARAVADDDPLEWVTRPPGSVSEIAAALTRAKLSEQLTDTVYSFGATRTVFRAYQFRPVIKLLRTGRRSMLIADEVGLGKTIEAGLIWTELDTRRQAEKVLVVCPSGLVDKWRQEMSERFGFETDKLDTPQLDELLDRFEVGSVPPRWRAVCSLERLRKWRGLARLNELAPHFDLIIVDEAHGLRNLGTLSHALGAQLSDWAGTLLFLSATPLNLGNDDLFNLLALLDPDEFEDRHALELQLEPNAVLNRISASLTDADTPNHRRREWLHSIRHLAFGSTVVGCPEFDRLSELLALPSLQPSERAEAVGLIAELNTLSTVITRTRKVEVDEDKTIRDPVEIAVSLTDRERRLYEAIHDWQTRRARSLRMPVHFVGQMPLRLAGSCLQAAKSQILERSCGVETDQWIDDDDEFDHMSFLEENDETAFNDGAFDPDAWDAPPAEVVDAANALGDVDTKFEQFVEALAAIIEQRRRVLVFTFSRGTIAYLADRLGAHFRACALHGGVPQKERGEIMRRFRDGQFDVMLATRVAGEGLDFEFCSAVVNYDLPWNPMEVEQRIGRIDRFGQEAVKIHVLNFRTPGTIESEIIARVHDRIRVFRSSIGELEPILRTELPNIRQAMFDPTLTPSERKLKIDNAMTALEIKAGITEDVLAAADSLTVLDNAEVDGFEDDLRATGRYVGQAELVGLLQEWAASAPGASCRRADKGPWLQLTGNASLADNLLGLQFDGELSPSEVTSLHAHLLNESEISLCLDQETARRRSADLLSARHPLVRAALRVPGTGRNPYGAVRIRTSDVSPGCYLVLVAISRWNGVRPSAELWTVSTAPDGRAVGESPGMALLAALAEGRLEPSSPELTRWEARHVRACSDQLDLRHIDEEDKRAAENRRLIDARQVSLDATYRRRIAGIDQRLETLGESARPEVRRLFESQRANQRHLYEEARKQLDAARSGSLSLTEIALCSMEAIH